MTPDAKFKNQVKKANTVNSTRISTPESAMLRKHIEDESYKVYVTKINMLEMAGSLCKLPRKP